MTHTRISRLRSMTLTMGQRSSCCSWRPKMSLQLLCMCVPCTSAALSGELCYRLLWWCSSAYSQLLLEGGKQGLVGQILLAGRYTKGRDPMQNTSAFYSCGQGVQEMT